MIPSLTPLIIPKYDDEPKNFAERWPYDASCLVEAALCYAITNQHQLCGGKAGDIMGTLQGNINGCVRNASG